jgi:hypothetical protein
MSLVAFYHTFSTKCAGPEAGPYFDSLGYVAFMSTLFPLGIPLYYVLALYNVRGAINTPLQSILKSEEQGLRFRFCYFRPQVSGQ